MGSEHPAITTNSPPSGAGPSRLPAPTPEFERGKHHPFAWFKPHLLDLVAK